jgi:hypothetical protein
MADNDHSSKPFIRLSVGLQTDFATIVFGDDDSG